MTGLLASLLLAAPSLAVPAPASTAVDVPAPAAYGDVRAVDLQWPNGVHIEIESTRDEIVVRFDRPADEAEIQRFAKDAGKDLADLRWNDTSLVMRAATGRRLEAIADDHGLHVTFLPDEDAIALSSSDTPKEADNGIELAIVRAQADAAAGYPGRARRRLAALAEQHSDDRRVQRALADAQAADDAIAAAAMGYRKIGADDFSARRAIAEAGGHVTALLMIRGGKTFSQVEGGASGSVRVTPSLAIGGGIRHIESHADIVAGPAGALNDVDSRSTIADALGTLHIGSAARLELQGSVQFEKRAGGGARLFVGSADRQARLNLAYRLPDVATPEQSTFGGHISRIGIGGTLRLSPELAVQGDVSRNGYGLTGMGVRSKTVSIAGGIDYLLRRRSPSLIVAYRLDAEYVDQLKIRSNGLAFIPLSDRENHTMQIVASTPVAKVQLTGAAGWTFDRLGKVNGPSANISAAKRLGDQWRFEANGGVSSISRPGIPGRQLYLRLVLTRYLGRR